jgi:hypothetical protein
MWFSGVEEKATRSVHKYIDNEVALKTMARVVERIFVEFTIIFCRMVW